MTLVLINFFRFYRLKCSTSFKGSWLRNPAVRRFAMCQRAWGKLHVLFLRINRVLKNLQQFFPFWVLVIISQVHQRDFIKSVLVLGVRPMYEKVNKLMGCGKNFSFENFHCLSISFNLILKNYSIFTTLEKPQLTVCVGTPFSFFLS